MFVSLVVAELLQLLISHVHQALAFICLFTQYFYSLLHAIQIEIMLLLDVTEICS